MMQKLMDELKSLLLIVAAVFVFRSSFLNWYVIPSGSLFPTLKIGDHVVVNKLSYGFMLPFMETRILNWGTPQRGDIVVFRGPESEQGLTLIKRVVGLPGDTVTFTNGTLTINGVLAKEEAQQDRRILENLGNGETGDGYKLYLESGFSHFPHYILRKQWGGVTENQIQTWVVPEGKLLLIGDNRDNSADGRFWGFMDEKRIYGRAFLISYSTYDTPGSLLPKFRNERWFTELKN